MVCLEANFIFPSDLRIRIQIKCAGISVYDCSHSIPFIISGNVNQRRDFHCLRHDRCMRNGRTMVHDHCEKFIFIHLHDFRRRQRLRHKDHRLISEVDAYCRATKDLNQAIGNLLHIVDSSTNDWFFQITECLNKLISVDHNCISSIHLFMGNAAFDCILITF